MVPTASPLLSEYEPLPASSPSVHSLLDADEKLQFSVVECRFHDAEAYEYISRRLACAPPRLPQGQKPLSITLEPPASWVLSPLTTSPVPVDLGVLIRKSKGPVLITCEKS